MNTTKKHTQISTKNERLSLKNRNLHRDINISGYKIKVSYNKETKQSSRGFAEKELTEYPKNFTSETFFIKNKEYIERYQCNDEYWEVPTAIDYYWQTLCIWVGLGLSLAGLVGLSNPNDSNILSTVLLTLGFSLFIFSIVVLLTKTTYQEQIYNRKKGSITFPNKFWTPNTTMNFKDIVFVKQYYRNNYFSILGLAPKLLFSHLDINLYSTKYQQLTLLTWYMDKNRPLPGMIQFEAYHEKDFERRKKEGFSPPQYFSFINTFEKTDRHQKERIKFWRDEINYDYEKKIKSTSIVRGKNEIFDMKSRKWHDKSMIDKIDGIFYSYLNL